MSVAPKKMFYLSWRNKDKVREGLKSRSLPTLVDFVHKCEISRFNIGDYPRDRKSKIYIGVF